MQHEESNVNPSGQRQHPEPEVWMEFLYEEVTPKRKRELKAHLAQCPACACQLEEWKLSKSALNEWKTPVSAIAPRTWRSVLQWAAAAALVLGFGFTMGRATSPGMKEIASLKASVNHLARTVQNERNQYLTNAVLAASATANAETLRLFAQYSLLQDAQRTSDQQNLRTVLESLDSRLTKVQSGLETVAINTAESFQQTHQNMARLASYSVPRNPVDTDPLSRDPK